MIRLLMEAVMVIAIVGGMVFMTKLSTNKGVTDESLLDEDDQDNSVQ